MRILLYVSCLLLATALPAFAQEDIRKVDFKNFTHSVKCIGDKSENITVKNGEFSREKQEDGYVDRFFFQIFDVAFGDVTGDKKDDAIVLGVCNTGGTGNFSEGFIYSMKAGKPTLIARIPGGDRAYGGLRETRVEDGVLVVESNEAGPEGGSCCPQVILTSRYKVTGGKLVPFGKETRRPLYPTERLAFDRGKSGKTMTLQIPVREGKRFIVGARAGQTLTVSVDKDDASIRLLEEADVKFGTNNFLVKLPKTGDYTIEVQNNSASELTVTLNVKIQ